jgi:hypothetical protein
VRRKRTPAGSPPDGGGRGSIDRASRRIPGASPRDRSTGLVNDTRRLCSRGFTRHAGSPAPRGSTRDTGPGVWLEQALEGKKPRRAPTRRPHPGQGLGSPRERTPEGSKASKWACRPFTGEPDGLRAGRGCGRRASARTTDLSRRCGEPCVPAHASGEPSGPPRQRVGARGKAPLKLGGRRAGGGRTRTHKEATARESGCGSSRGESSVGHLQGRERHGTRPRSFGASRKTACSARGAIRSAFAARTVERGKNPEDGTGEGSASPRPPQRRLSCRCGARGTRGSCVRGRNKPRRGGSRATRTIRPASADVAVREHGRQRRDELCRGTEPHERISWNSRPGSQLDEEYPAAVPNGEGGAPEANKALLGESKLLRKEPRVSEGDGHLMRGRPHAGDRG